MSRLPAGLECMPTALFMDGISTTMIPDFKCCGHFTILLLPASKINKLPHESSMIAVGFES